MLDAAERAEVVVAMLPRFAASAYGDPGMGQLDPLCPVEIEAGGESGAEMGVFAALANANRLANLARAIAEYLPVGLEAGAFIET